MKQTNIHYILLTIVCLTLIWSIADPQDTILTWVLEAAPVLIALPVLILTYNKYRFTTFTYAIMALHCVVLLYGAHYSYAEAPLGYWMEEWFGWTRNNYDKIGHFMQGFCPTLVAREILLTNKVLPRRKWLTFILLSIAMMVSAIYEIIEWAASISNPADTEAFLGTQGYIWDTQTDMLMCLIGSIVAMVCFCRLQDREMAKKIDG